MTHHAAVPVPDLLDDSRLRVYFGPRDSEGRTRVGFLETAPDDPANIQHVHEQPALGLGKLGAFDDSGVTPSCVVDVGDEKHLYYMGWNRGVTVPYRISIGLAVSTDGGVTFIRAHDGPILDRSPDDPYFVTTPFVLRDGGTWRMWYAAATSWGEVAGQPEPVYEIRHAESDDGVTWRRDGLACIAPTSVTEAYARPWVQRDSGGYRMWYCYRRNLDYRTDPANSYRLGYAESGDGMSWVRKDEQVGIERSETGWDSQMIEYPAVYEHRGARHLLYNGDGFGESGIGHAVLEAG
ncbi:MAG: hypothetical protein QOC92_1123 [Acidimicrobiaceae bacterium]|jgi:hypothetical protein